MKVLMVTGAIPRLEASSGSCVVLAGKLSALASKHRVTLVTFPPESAAEQSALASWRDAGVAVHTSGSRIPRVVVQAKRRFERAMGRMRAPGPLREPAKGDGRTQAVIDGLLLRESFDVVQAENIGVGHFRYATHVPKVLTEHEVGRYSTGGNEGWRLRQPRIWAGFDRIEVFTEQDADRLRSAAPMLSGLVRVNPFGIDLPVPARPDQEDANAMVFVGSFNHQPNVDAVTWLAGDILPLVRSRHPGVRLWLVGENPPSAIRRLASGAVIVTGRVNQVEPYLRTAAVVAAPVRGGGGMRRKVLQAMALGKAVVTTPLGAEGLAGPPEALPLRLAAGEREFSEHLNELLASREARRELGARAAAFVASHHSWTAHLRRIEATYAELGVS